jgi:hypothetical protein
MKAARAGKHIFSCPFSDGELPDVLIPKGMCIDLGFARRFRRFRPSSYARAN